MLTQDLIIFLDGQMIKANCSFIESLSPGRIRAEGVFETMRVYQGKLFAFESHLRRMKKGAKIFQITVPYSLKKIQGIIDQLLKMNHLKEARVRLAIFRDGRLVRISIVCQPLLSFSTRTYKEGFRAIILKMKHPRTKYSHVKSMDYRFFREALLAAERQGCQEALLLNDRNELLEGSRTNVFFVKNHVLYTPVVYCGCLNGITRQIVLKCAKKLGLSCKVVRTSFQQLREADEAFLTNSLIELMPLTVIEGLKIGRGTIGLVTSKILRAYREYIKKYCDERIC